MNSSVGLYQDHFGFRFDNSYLKLPTSLFAHQVPQHFKNPSLVIFNEYLAGDLGLNVDALKAADWSLFSGIELPEKLRKHMQATNLDTLLDWAMAERFCWGSILLLTKHDLIFN